MGVDQKADELKKSLPGQMVIGDFNGEILQELSDKEYGEKV